MEKERSKRIFTITFTDEELKSFVKFQLSYIKKTNDIDLRKATLAKLLMQIAMEDEDIIKKVKAKREG